MKVGDYVRTKDYHNIRSRIGKIIRQDGKYYYLDIDEDTQMVWEKDTILTSSPNIIDLIEVGDYVNGLKITYIDEPDEYNSQRLLYFEYPIDYVIKTFCNEDIKSIVTKECFKSMEYKVKE